MPPYKQTDMVGPSGSGEKAGSRLEVSAGPSSLGTRKAAAVPVRTKSGLKRKPGPGRTCNKFTKTGRKRQCRDPAAPKRARTAFNFFLRDFRKTYLAEHPETTGVIEVTKKAAAAWRSMTKEDKKDYDAMALVEKADYVRRKAEYVKNAGPEKFRLLRNNGKPKRPPTSYFHFLAFMRKTLRKPDGSPLEVKELSKKAGEKWRQMTPEEKEPYETLTAEAKAKFEMLRKLPFEELAFALKDGSLYYNDLTFPEAPVMPKKE
mmetsp:Transcript_10584/g.37555  ORF Transcript_10584/g.37555 Transcript_10584/m.37555 type:complete len:261 (+) Transcript_10584:775-1557(+)